MSRTASSRVGLARVPRFDRVLACFCAAAIALMAVAFPGDHLTLLAGPALRLAGVLTLLVAVVVFYAYRRAIRLANLVRMLFWALLLNTLCSLLFYLPVRAGVPLADPLFAHLDASLGFATSRLVAWSVARPTLNAFLFRVYDSLELFCVASVAIPALLGRVARTQIMLVSILFCVVLTVSISFLLPGVGPWETEPFTPTSSQVQCGVVVHWLKSARPYEINLQYRDPIITIPSWHVIFALLSAFVWRPFRYVWPLALGWSLLIALSTLTTGWHYAIDVILGVVVAAAAQALSTTLAPAFLDE
jgi:hypothetical protein